MPVTLAQTPVTYTTIYNNTPATSVATLFTSTSGNGIRAIEAINTTGSAATITLTLVKKGGTTSDAYAVTIANAFSVPANSVSSLIPSEGLHSALGELQMGAGDTLSGLQGTGSAITLLVFGV